MNRLLPPALVNLLRLRLRGAVRRVFRNVKTVRGAILFTAGTLLILTWLVPQIVWVFTQGRADPRAFRTIAPLAMLGLTILPILTSGQQKGIVFTPAEVDFLFSGPFSRRQLLAYKLAGQVLPSIFTALVLSLFLLRFARYWIAAFAGLLLVVWFMQLFAICAFLIGQTVAETAYTRARRWIVLVVLGLVGLGLGISGAEAAADGLWPLLERFQQSLPGRIVLAPFEVFTQVITTRHLLTGFFVWGAIALGMDLVLLVIVMGLDVNYLEVSAAASRKIYERLQRARRGGYAWAARPTARWRLPRFPWWGGAGPIIRKQVIAASRNMRGMVFFLVIFAAAVAPTLATVGRSQGIPVGALAGPLAMLTVMFTAAFPYDFRGDVDHMDWLKSLPVGSLAVAVGELVTPVAMMTALHLAVLAAVLPFVQGQPGWLVVIACFTVPLNFILFALENLMFLLYPSRVTGMATPGDFQRMGRVMVEMMAKFIVLGACGGLAALVALAAYYPFGESWLAALGSAWLVLALCGSALMPLIAWAFRRFDVSLDTPV